MVRQDHIATTAPMASQVTVQVSMPHTPTLCLEDIRARSNAAYTISPVFSVSLMVKQR